MPNPSAADVSESSYTFHYPFFHGSNSPSLLFDMFRYCQKTILFNLPQEIPKQKWGISLPIFHQEILVKNVVKFKHKNLSKNGIFCRPTWIYKFLVSLKGTELLPLTQTFSPYIFDFSIILWYFKFVIKHIF